MQFHPYKSKFVISAVLGGQRVYAIPGLGKYDFVFPGHALKQNRTRSNPGEPITIDDACRFNFAAAMDAYTSICERANEAYPGFASLSLECLDS